MYYNLAKKTFVRARKTTRISNFELLLLLYGFEISNSCFYLPDLPIQFKILPPMTTWGHLVLLASLDTLYI